MSIYGGTYVTFIAIEFSLYETILRQIETICEDKSLLSFSLERIETIKQVHWAAKYLVQTVVDTIYYEEVDEMGVEQREFHHEKLKLHKEPKEKGIIDDFEQEE